LDTFLNKVKTQEGQSAGVLALNLDGVLVDVNDQYLEMTGFTKEYLLGKNIDDIDDFASNKIFSKEKTTFGHYH